LAAEAAANGTKADFAELQASIDRMKESRNDQERFFEENRIFHSTIARASGNRVLEAFWSTISILASGEHHGLSYSLGNQLHVIEAHERILAACRKRNGEAAAAAMREHVEELETLVRRRFRHLLGQPTSIVARPGRTVQQP
jgi:DNA-binding GntR family transcriptional regulator